MILNRPGADQMQSSQTLGARAPQRLTIHRNLLEAQGLKQGTGPTQNALLQGLRLQTLKDAFEGVVRRNAVGQTQESAKPVAVAAAEDLDIDPRVSPADDGSQGDGDDVQERMPTSPPQARVAQLRKMLLEGQT